MKEYNAFILISKRVTAPNDAVAEQAARKLAHDHILHDSAMKHFELEGTMVEPKGELVD